MKLKKDYKEFLITTKMKLSASHEFFVCNDGILNPLKVKKI